MYKRILISFSILFLTHVTYGQVYDQRITWDYDGQTFAEFVTKAESLFNVTFFYKKEWVNDIRLKKTENESTLSGLLNNTFKSRKIYYSVDKDGNIILTKDFKIKNLFILSGETDGYIPGTDYSNQVNQQKTTENMTVEIGNPAEKSRSGNVVISGYVKNRDSKEPIVAVAIYVKELSIGSLTNEYGFYSINVPRGNYNIRYTYLGMKEMTIAARVYGSGKLDVEMKEVLIPLRETIVIADKNAVLQRFEVGLEKLNMRTFKLMPTSMGETDILKGMLLVSGVKTVGEGSSGYNVRGGAADQNLILLYGAPVYNTSHFFGFFSAVNSDVIKDVLLYKGGIPAQYGGRISSVLDIIPFDGNKKEVKGNAGISPITTHLTLEVPLIKEKLSLVLAGRTTYSNWVLGRIKNQAIQNSRASFYDFNARLVYEINNDNKVELSSYLSHDSFRFNTDTTYSYNNQIFSLKWRHIVNTNFVFVLSSNSSIYNYSVESRRIIQNSYAMNHKINSVNLKADFNWYPGKKQKFNFGADINRYSILPGEYLPASDSSLVAVNIIERERAIEGALYAEDKINLTDYLSINLGLRFSAFSSLGPKDLLMYDPDQPMTESTVTDTLRFKSGKFYKTYAGPEYRISLNIKLTNSSSLKLNYNRTRQYLHLLSNTTSIAPTDTWKLSDNYFRPQIGDQFAIGYYLEIPSQKLELSSEVYYKKINNMIDFKGGTDLIMNRHPERDIINVTGKAYGIEFMIKRSLGKFNLSTSYAYSRVLIKSISKFSSDAINEGNWFPASYDKPHDFSLMLNYLMTRRTSCSVNYTYNTGRPITYPVSLYRNNNMILVQYSDRNKYRIPDYSRLDLSLRLSGNLRSHKVANPAWTFSVYNALGRENVYSVFFKSTGKTVVGYRLSVFAQAIPTVTYSFDF
jgi:hypothetical protein